MQNKKKTFSPVFWNSWGPSVKSGPEAIYPPAFEGPDRKDLLVYQQTMNTQWV